MPNVQFTALWQHEDLAACQDSSIFQIMRDYRAELHMEWRLFKMILEKYPDIFSLKYIDEGLFMNMYGQVCTRCFGYGLPSCSMVPMADNLNHSHVPITNELVSKLKHKDTSPADTQYFKRAKMMNDYSHHYDAEELVKLDPK